jgi:cytochrome c biogenesis factor
MVLSLFGNILLLMTLASSSAAIVIKGRSKIYTFFVSCSLPNLSFILLVLAFVESDFGIRNVFLNSSTELPLVYKFAASFASHEGSILLWDSFLGLVSLIYIHFVRISKEAKDFGISIFAFIQVVFVSFIIFTSNPFASFSFIPSEGLGLNPMLQDVASINFIHRSCISVMFATRAIFAGCLDIII